MKSKKTALSGFVFILFMVVLFSGCKKEKDDVIPPVTTTQTPSTFKVDVPSSLNSPDSAKSINTIDTLSGDDIYRNLRTFINVGCAAADVIQNIMTAIHSMSITTSMSFTWTSNVDGRSKSFTVVQNQAFNGTTYQFRLTISDGSSQAIQVFWNNSPVKGVAIISPYDWDRTHFGTQYSSTRYMVEYSEAGEGGYDKQMTVSIVQFPQLVAGFTNYINNLKMFVGKKNNLLTIFGNSNHPSATLVDVNLVGKDYAFVAHSDANLNIGVAKVAITPSTVSTVTDIFNAYSVDSVLSSEIHTVYPAATQAQINSYLSYTDQPAYFVSTQGFVSCGANIPGNTGFTTSFIDLSGLSPYIPSDIKNLTISFQ